MLSDVFFDQLRIPAPDVHLGVGSGMHGVQTGAMDGVFGELSPDWVLVYGDTNSTLAETLSADNSTCLSLILKPACELQSTDAGGAQSVAHRPLR
jgi:UDP-N-acetylglucosamine 2-epimerase